MAATNSGSGSRALPGCRMPPLVEFRSALPEEIASIVMPIERAGQPHPWSEAMFLQELANDFSELELLLVDGQAVGFVVYWLVADEVHLLNVVVAEASRSRGYGALLVGRVVAVAEEMGSEQVCLEVRVGNGAGLSNQQIEACIKDPANLKAAEARSEAAVKAGVTGTPSFFVNDVAIVSPGSEGATLADLSRAIDAELAKG